MMKTTIIGNLTADPELRTVPSGISVCTFTVAANKRFSKDKEKQTEFLRVSAWRQLGENCAKYLSKGKKVAVIGEISARAYETKTGDTRISLELTADEVEFLSPASERGEVTNVPSFSAHNEPAPVQGDNGDGWQEITDGDLPF